MTERQTKIESGDWTGRYRGARVHLYRYDDLRANFHESELPALIKVLRGIQAAMKKKRETRR